MKHSSHLNTFFLFPHFNMFHFSRSVSGFSADKVILAFLIYWFPTKIVLNNKTSVNSVQLEYNLVLKLLVFLLFLLSALKLNASRRGPRNFMLNIKNLFAHNLIISIVAMILLNITEILLNVVVL